MFPLALLALLPMSLANILKIDESPCYPNVTILRSSLKSVGSEGSSISLNLTLQATTALNESATIEVIIAESREVRKWLGRLASRRVEMSPVVLKCSQGKLNVDGMATIYNNFTEIVSGKASVRKTMSNLTEGIYYTLVANCSENVTALNITGTLEAMNPYGYLPGEAYAYLNFYKFLTGFYALLFFVWTALICLHRDSTTGVQRWAVTCVLAAALIEYMLSFGLCDYMNLYGTQPGWLVHCAAVTKAFKDTFTRAFMVAISKGVGVMRDSMERASFLALMVICIMYLFSHLIYEAQLYQSMINHEAHPGQLLSSLLLSVCSTVLFYWIYVSLVATIKELKMSKQTFKLQKMKQVAIALKITAIWAISWIFFQRYFICSYFMLMKCQDDYWRFYWLFEAMWQLIFLFVVCALAWLWRPDEQWAARASSEQLNQDDELETEKQVEMVSARTMGYMLGSEEQD